MDLISKFSSEAFRYYFMRECPFPGDGEFSWERFATVYNSDLGKKLGNLLSRVTTLVISNFDRVLPGTARQAPAPIVPDRPGRRPRGQWCAAQMTRRNLPLAASRCGAVQPRPGPAF